jgi:hypothetical protein
MYPDPGGLIDQITLKRVRRRPDARAAVDRELDIGEAAKRTTFAPVSNLHLRLSTSRAPMGHRDRSGSPLVPPHEGAGKAEEITSF